MPANSTNTKILLDGGDPNETLRIKSLLGFLDGQTTNPTYVSKNPEVQRRIASGHKLSWEEQKQEYKDIVSKISPLVGSAGVSIEVFADFDSTAEQMLAQGEEMFAWIPNAYIKYPCIKEGLQAAKMSVERNMRVNMTLCFSQSQAAKSASSFFISRSRSSNNASISSLLSSYGTPPPGSLSSELTLSAD